MDRWLTKTILGLGVLLFSCTVHAADVSLAWDPAPGTITGYRVYAVPYADAFDYTTPLYEGPATTCTINGLPDSIELKFVARAYLIGSDGAVYESADSNQITHAVIVWSNPNLRIQ